ncbi:Putative Flp pilus-assembly TadE/G-like [Palleronia marisminoris]|uniref:von Willebrand factor type A domain protein n=1 Tax=Palleronia marisminoris TaxID=315423 RepID=A0A1Y5REK3_9RHOB|nr:TadE/TadG family type IV pilus assembly protein [Palleronia marisminoris]SFG15640.1 Putative Flp pilus-assembly TadE/G-like [Palleronia marisminoris]SLN15719.1 von Willebrand factor type A domain protein [Palleronia marisminoris]
MAARSDTIAPRHRLRHRVSAFARAEDGSFVILTLFFFAAIFLTGGVVVDLLRHDYQRTQLQTTLDNAVLAAADLDQSLDPEGVVADYFAKAGLADALTDIQVTSRINSRAVSANAELSLPTMFMHALGVDDLGGAAGATAREDIRDIEISMALDISGSMGNHGRLGYMKTAAKEFVDKMLLDGNGNPIEGEVSINIVPYATQVNAGADILAQMAVTHSHGYSHCLDFSAGAFRTVEMSPTTPYRQTAHFDPYPAIPDRNDRRFHDRVSEGRIQCRTDASSRTLFVSDDRDALHDKIDSLQYGGNTSIEIGTKWAIGLLDPQMRSAVAALPDIDEGFRDRPFDYDRENSMKVLIIMTDGENTTQLSMKPAYSGSNLSDIWKGYDGSYLRFSVQSSDPSYYFVAGRNEWRRDPVGGSSAERMTWAEVWAEMPLAWHAYYARAEQVNSQYRQYVANDWYSKVLDSIGPNEKDDRLTALCSAIRDRDVVVFTIAFDISEGNSKLLKACATTPNHYYNVTGSQINYAFASIAGTINQLQLVE